MVYRHRWFTEFLQYNNLEELNEQNEGARKRESNIPTSQLIKNPKLSEVLKTCPHIDDFGRSHHRRACSRTR